jgi:hypothetical protein
MISGIVQHRTAAAWYSTAAAITVSVGPDISAVNAGSTLVMVTGHK